MVNGVKQQSTGLDLGSNSKCFFPLIYSAQFIVCVKVFQRRRKWRRRKKKNMIFSSLTGTLWILADWMAWEIIAYIYIHITQFTHKHTHTHSIPVCKHFCFGIRCIFGFFNVFQLFVLLCFLPSDHIFMNWFTSTSAYSPNSRPDFVSFYWKKNS